MGFLMVLQRLVIVLPASDMEFNRCPFWVQVHGLPLEKLTKANGEIIGNRVGRLIKVQAHCDGLLLYRNFLRISVDIDVTKSLPRGFILNRGENAQMTSLDPWISFKYENFRIFVTIAAGFVMTGMFTGIARSSGFPMEYYRKKVDELEARVKPLLHRKGPQLSAVPPLVASREEARNGEPLRPAMATEANVTVRPDVGVLGQVMERVETAEHQGQRTDTHEKQSMISGVGISNFHSAEGRFDSVKAVVGPSMGVRSEPYGFGPDMQARPQYFVTEPVDTIGLVTKNSSFPSEVHSGGPSAIEEIPSVVPSSGTREKVRKIVSKRRKSGDKGLFDVEMALVEFPDAKEAHSLLVRSSPLVDECCSQLPSTFPSEDSLVTEKWALVAGPKQPHEPC
ncbi:hypothetical protein ACSBR2_003351 [Camellia fascicularis]